MDDEQAKPRTRAAVDQQLATSRHMLVSARALLREVDVRRRQALVGTFLTRTIQSVQPGQEDRLDELERDLDGWLALNQLEHLRELLCRQIAARRAHLAAHRHGQARPPSRPHQPGR